MRANPTLRDTRAPPYGNITFAPPRVVVELQIVWSNYGSRPGPLAFAVINCVLSALNANADYVRQKSLNRVGDSSV
jgi:hypothetical protein